MPWPPRRSPWAYFAPATDDLIERSRRRGCKESRTHSFASRRSDTVPTLEPASTHSRDSPQDGSWLVIRSAELRGGPNMMDSLDALDMSFEEFDRRLAAVEPRQWALATPCEGWSVCDLVDHMWFGCMAYVEFFEGLTYRQVLTERPPTLTPAVVADQYRVAASSLVDVFRRPGALATEIQYPRRSHTTGTDLAVFRLFDNVVHTWDLAHALGVDEHIDEELVALTYEQVIPHIEFYRSLGALTEELRCQRVTPASSPACSVCAEGSAN